MKQTYPLTRDLVFVGGGHSHALVLRKWGMKPMAGVRVTVINPGPTAPYSGMLPGFVAGHYERDELDIDLVKLCRFAGARLIIGAVDGIDIENRLISVPERPPIAYDVASIDVGITSEMPRLDGFSEHAFPAKPLGIFAQKWDAYRTTITDPKIVIIGGGVAGAELAMAMQHSVRDRAPEVTIIDTGRALKSMSEKANVVMREQLKTAGIELIEQSAISAIFADQVLLEDGRKIAANFVNGAAVARPHGWISDTGLAVTGGYIDVDATLLSSDSHVFAVGDCANMTASPRPKAGVFAVRQAPVLFDNIRASLSSGRLRPFAPQKDYLKLISLGDKAALADKWGRVFHGPAVWRLKNRIDAQFMNRFTHLPAMDTYVPPKSPVTDGLLAALDGGKPMCSGCGAKVGRGVLNGVVAGLLDAPGDDAAVLKMGKIRQVISTDHLAAVTHDHAVMTRIAAVHALGDIWAMGATPQAALTSLILPRMSPDLQQRTLAEIMAVAREVMEDAGAKIVGGHTSMGDSLTIGFSVTGLCEHAPIGLNGAKVGDVLILTKPIGSGTILAAEMAGEARGADVSACFEAMGQGQGVASMILAKAHAMTDVTGFGLAGHLAGICEASGLGAEVILDDVTFLSGAVALAENGTRSSLYDDNRSGSGPVFGAEGARGALLFDPQTAGGLLAAIPARGAKGVLKKLREAGYPAVQIGVMIEGEAVRVI